MRKIYIYSTVIGTGKGGISTALQGYVDGLKFLGVEYVKVITHSSKRKFFFFFKAILISINLNNNSICWFHVGPWFSMFRKLALLLICKLKGAEIIVHFHSPKTFCYLNNKFFSLLILFFITFSDKIVLLTPWWLQEFEKKYPNYKNKFIISLNPIDSYIEQCAIDTDFSKTVDKDKTILLSMARLEKMKGIDIVIKAIHKLPTEYILYIGGEGGYRSNLERLAKKLNLENRVIFLGWLDKADKVHWLRKADFFCLPSKYDSFGMVYIEAMAFGLPVVALKYQAIPDVVPSEYGVLLETDSSSDIAKAIMNLNNRFFEREKIKKDTLYKFNNIIITKKFLKSIDYFSEEI